MRYRLGERVAQDRGARRLPHAVRPRRADARAFSAGHVLGSAQLRVYAERGRRGLHGRPLHRAHPRRRQGGRDALRRARHGVDVRPRALCLPAEEETLAAIRRFVDDALDGVTPVLLGYALGKAQEILEVPLRRGLRLPRSLGRPRGEPDLRGRGRLARERGRSGRRARGLGEVVVAPPHCAQPGDAGRAGAAPRSSPAGRSTARAGSAASTRRSRSQITPTTCRFSATRRRPAPRACSRCTATPTRWPPRPHRGRAGRALREQRQLELL